MTQVEVLELLQREGWLLSSEIREKLNMGIGPCVRTIKKLLEYNFIVKEKASKVIKDKNRLKRTSKIAYAYNARIQ